MKKLKSMDNRIKRNILICAALVIAAAIAFGAVMLYRSKNTKLLDKTVYNEFKDSIELAADPEAGGFESQDELRSFICEWADSHELEYKVDKAGSIIFDKAAVGRKKNVSPTLVCVCMNYQTAAGNVRLLASAASIAYSDIDSGRKTVVFVNDEKSLGTGFKSLSSKYIKAGSKVIYLDAGSSSYLSTGSFQERFSTITVPAKRESNECDTAVRITIKGISTGVVGPSISKQPDPISAFSTLLTRLKSKSATYRVADLEVGTNGNMYPVSIEATVALNSYAVSSFTAYIDKRIKAWEKAYGSSNPELEYSYEVIDDPDELPKKTYTAGTTDRLTGILYTVRSGAYRYSESDAIPDGKDKGDVYAINCLLDIETSRSSIDIKLLTQGYDDSFTERVINDNKAGASLYDCSCEQTAALEAFANDRDSLALTFRKTYEKVNDKTQAASDVPAETDNFFTPCTYLQQKEPDADIIHIRMNGSAAARIANTVLCYIKTKGNTSFF